MPNSYLGGVIPVYVPALSVLLADLSSPSAPRLARAFGVSRSTAYRWIKRDNAPRAVLLALYLAAPGYGGADTFNKVLHAQEGARLALGLADSMKRETEALRRELARVVNLGDFGAANEPTRVPLPLVAVRSAASDR